MRLHYTDLSIGQKVKVQVYYDKLTDCFYEGEITNMDGQNIIVKVESRDFSKDTQDLKQRDYEACNPSYAVVTSV